MKDSRGMGTLSLQDSVASGLVMPLTDEEHRMMSGSVKNTILGMGK